MRGFARTFFRSPTGIASILCVLILVLVAIWGPIHWGAEAVATDLTNAGSGPSPGHLFGTDRLGRDILARTLTATRLTLQLSLAAAGLAALFGFTTGAGISLLGPRLRGLMARFIDALLAFPAILTAMIVAAVVEPGPRGAIVAVAVSFAPTFARLSNSLAASVAEREYIAAARVVGISPARVLFRYVLPNIAEPLIVSLFNAVGTSLVAISSLSFLGLGVQAPSFDWGRLLTEGVQAIYVTPLAALAPTAAIAGTGLAVGFLGDSIARAMNPLLWTAGRERRVPVPPPPTKAAAAAVGPELTATDDRDWVIAVEGLTVQFPSGGKNVSVVDDVTIRIAKGDIVGIVGESGSGKSMTALALAQLVPYPGTVRAGKLELLGEPLAALPPPKRERWLGRHLAMIFQDPNSSLNPALRIETQLTESARTHRQLNRPTARELAVKLLTDVQIPAPEARLRQYPHQFSGGMRQRVMIAMSLMNQPAFMIADEPTTALDVTVQAQIIDLLRDVNQAQGTAVMLISHDLGVISALCHRVMVMYAGRIVEDAPLEQLLASPAHPYTRALMAAVPDLTADRSEPLASIPGGSPNPAAMPPGCPFAGRCADAVARCRTERPPLSTLAPGRSVACWVAMHQVAEGQEAYA